MWIFTKEGFFSVVEDKYCGKDELMVRARVKSDLVRLAQKMDISFDILVIDHSDYRYRGKIARTVWENYCSLSAAEIDYSNVKGTISGDDHERSDAYMGVWSSLFSLQPSGRRVDRFID